MPTIDGDRLLRDLHALHSFGRYRSGVHRPTYTPEDMAARRWLMGRMTEAGLAASVDGIGNVYGDGPAPGGRRLLAGSHLESQNHAGWLDGALGVAYALEVVRACREDPASHDLAIDVVAFADEEGHYGSFTGSRSLLGLLDEAEIDRLTNRYHGKPLRDALGEAGLAGLPRRRLDPARYAGFLEAHIEQGDTLESLGDRLGVVTAIVAIWQYRITVEGAQNHAGTTRMAVRRDAGLAAVRLLAAIDRRFPEVAGPRSVWTTGRILLEPGAPSIIPGRAEILFQLRDAEPETLARMEVALAALAAEADTSGPCRVSIETLSKSTPAQMDPRLMGTLAAAAERRAPGRWQHLPSGAGHDAQWLARVMPAAMLFVPSIGGVSHHWSEDTAEADIVLGCQVLADAAEAILRAAAQG